MSSSQILGTYEELEHPQRISDASEASDVTETVSKEHFLVTLKFEAN